MNAMLALETAFDEICPNASKPVNLYVALFERCPYYGGPEEGGWWGTDHILIKYVRCETQEAADKLKERIEQKAKELSDQARRDYGNQCLSELEQADRLGLDYDSLPEVDGESSFYVAVCEDEPSSTYGTRQWD